VSAEAEGAGDTASGSASALSSTGLRARWFAAYAGWTERISRWFERSHEQDTAAEAQTAQLAAASDADSASAPGAAADRPRAESGSTPPAASRGDDGARA
jgi:hypothetical protein